MKMKVVPFAGLLIGCISSLSFAANPDTGPGCGLGKLAWADYKNQKAIGPQVLMATTNATGMQTFGISSGTSGCTNDGTVFASEKTRFFAAMNSEALEQEMAQGGGEHLAALATLLGVPSAEQPRFFERAQQQYRSLLEAGEPTGEAMLRAVDQIITAEPTLVAVSLDR